MIFHSRLPKFLPALEKLTQLNSLAKENILTDEFLIEKEEKLAMYYAPHNEYINTHSQVVIVGITPGWNQMKTAFNQIIGALDSFLSPEEMLKQAKIAASFYGQIRANLTSMLDQCELAEVLGLQSTDQLFTEERSRLHTTSIIRYPVFYKGKNYTGHAPAIHQSALLKRYAYDVFPEELNYISESALIIPLGKVTEKVIAKVGEDFTCLTGFPHPSGANGHRVKQFRQNHRHLRSIVQIWGNPI